MQPPAAEAAAVLAWHRRSQEAGVPLVRAFERLRGIQFFASSTTGAGRSYRLCFPSPQQGSVRMPSSHQGRRFSMTRKASSHALPLGSPLGLFPGKEVTLFKPVGALNVLVVPFLAIVRLGRMVSDCHCPNLLFLDSPNAEDRISSTTLLDAQAPRRRGVPRGSRAQHAVLPSGSTNHGLLNGRTMSNPFSERPSRMIST